MSAEIITLADHRKAAAAPLSSGNLAATATAFASACRALTASLDRVRQHSAAIRADLERLQRGAILEAAQALTGVSRSPGEPAHA